MAIHLSISLQKEFKSEADARAYEADVLEKAQEFVASLDGVQAASGQFGFLSGQSLLSDPAPDAGVGAPVEEEPPAGNGGTEEGAGDGNGGGETPPGAAQS